MTPAAKRKAPKKSVHRGIVLASPPMTGPDVEALQVKLNERAEDLSLPWLRVRVDGAAGKRTMRSARLIGWALGFVGTPMTNLEHGRVGRYAQRVLRGTVKRTNAQRKTAKGRAAKLRKIRQRHNTGAAAAIRIAERHVGATESPANSNRGPGIITNCQRAIIGYDGVPWCGCFVGFVLREAGVKGITSRIAYTPYIVEDGRAGRYGMAGIVSFENAKPGDLLVFDFDGGGADHVGLATSRSAGGRIETIEGNTSPDSGGSQANGGGCFRRTRDRSTVLAVVRPNYAG